VPSKTSNTISTEGPTNTSWESAGTNKQGASLVWFPVPELGVKIRMERARADDTAYYAESTEEDTDATFALVYFGRKSVVDFKPECNAEHDPDLAIMKITGQLGDGQLHGDQTLLKQFDGFYLILGGRPQASCLTREETERYLKTKAVFHIALPPTSDDVELLEINQ
jgi:hypothetical protein